MRLFRLLPVLPLSILSLWVALVLFLCPVNGRAEAPLTPGFLTLGIWEPQRGLRLDVALWYPARRSPSEVKYNDWTFSVARGAAVVPGLHPLVLLSHDTSGSRFSLHFLAEALARSGFVVAAPTHVGDNMDDMAHLFTVDQLRNRARELTGLLDVLLETDQVAKMVDPNRVAVVGVGPGATAALLLAGGKLDGEGWTNYCRRVGGADPYCTPWVRARMDRMAEAIGDAGTGDASARRTPTAMSDLADPRVKAAVLAAPAYGMFFSRTGLAAVSLPLLILRADLDAVNRAPHHAESIRDALPRLPAFDVLEHTDKASLMAPCSPTLAQMLPDLCTPEPEANSLRSRRQLSDKTIRFLLQQLGNVS